jgi:hypothetical protein
MMRPEQVSGAVPRIAIGTVSLVESEKSRARTASVTSPPNIGAKLVTASDVLALELLR